MAFSPHIHSADGIWRRVQQGGDQRAAQAVALIGRQHVRLANHEAVPPAGTAEITGPPALLFGGRADALQGIAHPGTQQPEKRCRGTLDLLHGVVSAMGVLVFTAVAAVRTPAGLSIGIANVAATTVTWVLLGWCLAGIALVISASSGRRSATLGLSAAVALFAYLADSFLPLIDHLSWIRNISPYYWFTGGDPLQNGLQLVHCLLLIVTAIVATALAVVAFDRRDLRV